MRAGSTLGTIDSGAANLRHTDNVSEDAYPVNDSPENTPDDPDETDIVGDSPEDIDDSVECDLEVDLPQYSKPQDVPNSSEYPDEFHTKIPSAKAKIWTKLPNGLISETPEQVDIVMDEKVLKTRTAQFGQIASALVTLLLKWLLCFGIEARGWQDAIIGRCAGVFLRCVDPAYFAEFVTSNTSPYFIYLVLNPEFRPSDLLRLPRVAKTDVGWGEYMSLFMDKHGNIVGWYVGSATGFGTVNSRPSGIIGRILSYWATKDTKYKHAQWLHSRPDLTVRFVKIADVSPRWAGLHRVYTLALETLFIVLLTFDTNLQTSSKFRAPGTAGWVVSFRKDHGIAEHPTIQGLNHALPLKQGVPVDQRFLPEARTCSNPIAVCKAGIDFKPSQWVSFVVGQFWSGKHLCGACSAYHREEGVHRPQAVVDSYRFRAKGFIKRANTCYWCFKDLPHRAVGTAYDHGNRRHSLEVCGEQKVLCERCGADWKNFDKRLFPIPGVHIPADHQFKCQIQTCARKDKTMAKKWLFTDSGLLQCETCRFAITVGMTNNEKKMARRRLKEIDDDGKVPHKLCMEDIKLAARGKGATGKLA